MCPPLQVKGLLREPQLELLDLPVGTYEVMVRCRSKNNNIWSQWSAPLVITVPLGHTGGIPQALFRNYSIHSSSVCWFIACRLLRIDIVDDIVPTL